ncbi:MAG: hypothetical protein ACLGH6_01970 [Gammaproteobacteria bacterium]
MSTNRWVNPVNNNLLRDLEGTLLPGGTLEFYAAGTSTPLAVYSDRDQTVSLGSTLTADAYGLIEDFHLPQNTTFKAIAKDSGGATKWTRDYLYTVDGVDLDTRLDAVETTIAALNTGVLNGLINGGMRQAAGDVLTLTTSFAEGKVNRLFGRATNVTAGTLTQGASVDYASNAYGHFSGVSLSAAGVVEAQIRVAAGEAARFVDAATVFSALVYQDTGSALDYTITIKTPTSTADDFSSLTTIGTDVAQSVTSGTDTRLEFAIADMGDCSKGIAIEISASVGAAITTKNFRITEAQLERGANRTSFVMTHYDAEKAAIYAGNQYADPTCNGRLAIDGANLKLSPYNGDKINIDGTVRTIPSAGVTLGIGAASASTTYYIYAYYTGLAIALEFSATGYATSTSNGVAIKSGDSTRTLVGMARTNASPAWSLVRSYCNDPGVVALSPLTSDVTAPGGASYVEVSSALRAGFLVWSDETVSASANGALESPTPSANGFVSIGFDGTTAEDVYVRHFDADANSIVPIALTMNKRGLSEGYHYATLLHYGEAKILGSATAGQRTTMQVSICRR